MTKNTDPYEFVEPQTAFHQAIAAQVLSDNPNSPRYAGGFMYMGTEKASTMNGGFRAHLFKNINTRKYIRHDLIPYATITS
jgi:hypothetical protein